MPELPIPQPALSATSATPRSQAQIVRVSDAHDEALAAFFREVWNPAATAQGVRAGRAASAASNPVAPGQEPPAYVFLYDGRVVGYVTSIPVRFWSGGQDRAAHWVKGLMVLPEFRNGPIGFLLLKEILSSLEVALALTVVPASLRLFQAMGFADAGQLFNAVRILRPARVLRQLDLERLGLTSWPHWLTAAFRLMQRLGLASLMGHLLSGMAGLWCWVRGGSTLTTSLQDKDPDPAALDALWQRMRSQVGASPVRDGRWLKARYPTGEGLYRFVAVRDDATLAGLAVVRRPRSQSDVRLGDLRVATVSEILFPPHRPEVGLALLAGAEEQAREWNADAVLCSGTHPALLAVLRRRAYLKVPGNLHFLASDRTAKASLPEDFCAWWLTRGDSNSDEVF